MSEQWYVSSDGTTHGPYSTEQVAGLASAGKLMPEDMVLKVGTDNWIVAHTVFFTNTWNAPPPPHVASVAPVAPPRQAALFAPVAPPPAPQFAPVAPPPQVALFAPVAPVTEAPAMMTQVRPDIAHTDYFTTTLPAPPQQPPSPPQEAVTEASSSFSFPEGGESAATATPRSSGEKQNGKPQPQQSGWGSLTTATKAGIIGGFVGLCLCLLVIGISVNRRPSPKPREISVDSKYEKRPSGSKTGDVKHKK